MHHKRVVRFEQACLPMMAAMKSALRGFTSRDPLNSNGGLTVRGAFCCDRHTRVQKFPAKTIATPVRPIPWSKA